jgi:hypothetical protein
MATSFAHKGHHQATSQKLKKAGTYSAKSSVDMGSHLYSYKYLLTALRYAIYSIMCRGSVMEGVSTFKIYKILTLVNIFSGLNL